MSYDSSPDQTQKDLIDLITESAQRVEETPDADGKLVKVLTTDPETIYWKTQIVNSPNFARFVYELKNLEGLGKQAKNHMSFERAAILEKQIAIVVEAYKYSIDAKSSETQRDKRNTQSNLIDRLNRVKIEKSFTARGDAHKSIWQSFTGSEEKKDD